MPRITRILLLPLLVAATLASVPAPGHAAEWLGWNAGLKRASDSGRPVLVDVYTDWCGWCKRMDRDVYGRADVDRYLASHFVLVRLNAESGEQAAWQGRAYSARSLSSAFGVSGYPTTIFLASDGTRIVNAPGYIEGDRFMLLLRYIGDGWMQRNVKWDDYLKQAQGGR
jgi:thioredoxin-related protein